MIIISTSSNPDLAENIARINNIKNVPISIKRFSDLELQISILDEIENETVIICGSISKPANDNLMELLLVIDAARNARAKKIIVAIPYFGYARQDHIVNKGEPLTARLVAKMLETAGADMIITLEPHSNFLKNFFTVPIIYLESYQLFYDFFKFKEYTVISPDEGGGIRAEKFSKALGFSIAKISKRRIAPDKCEMIELNGLVKGKNCLIVDDIIDTAATISMAVEVLVKSEAKSIDICATHAVLSSDAIARLQKKEINNIYISNSIVHLKLINKIKVVPIDKIFSEAILKLI